MSMVPIWAVSGFGIHEDVKTQFDDFKLKREPHHYRYFIYKIVDGDGIVIESTGPPSETYEDFAAKLLDVPTECRYGVVEVDLTSKDGRPTSKLVFLSWSPGTAHVKSKMVYASARDDIKRVMKGVGIYLTATDAEELSREWIEDSVARYL